MGASTGSGKGEVQKYGGRRREPSACMLDLLMGLPYLLSLINLVTWTRNSSDHGRRHPTMDVIGSALAYFRLLRVSLCWIFPSSNNNNLKPVMEKIQPSSALPLCLLGMQSTAEVGGFPTPRERRAS